jgi:hypothetical protein
LKAGSLASGGSATLGNLGTGNAGGDTGGSTGGTGDNQVAGAPPILGGSSDGGSPEGGTGGIAPSPAPSPNQSAIEAQTIARWNAIADHRTGDMYNFHWTKDMFPHPTFAAMGEAKGYQEFASVLETFLGQNFDFLAQERQFLTPYYYVTASTADVDLEVTWDELATDFSTLNYGDIPAAVQQSLGVLAAAMKNYE